MPQKAAALAHQELSPALTRLQGGEITLDAYLDECVEGAVAHLVGQLDDEALESVRETIRAQLRMDPLLTAVVERLAKRDPGLPSG